MQPEAPGALRTRKTTSPILTLLPQKGTKMAGSEVIVMSTTAWPAASLTSLRRCISTTLITSNPVRPENPSQQWLPAGARRGHDMLSFHICHCGFKQPTCSHVLTGMALQDGRGEELTNELLHPCRCLVGCQESDPSGALEPIPDPDVGVLVEHDVVRSYGLAVPEEVRKHLWRQPQRHQHAFRSMVHLTICIAWKGRLSRPTCMSVFGHWT